MELGGSALADLMARTIEIVAHYRTPQEFTAGYVSLLELQARRRSLLEILALLGWRPI
jgi:hypothetical protein